MDSLPPLPDQVLEYYADLDGARVSRLGNGLINQTFLVEAERGCFVLQRLASIFSPAINSNIAKVTDALAAAGLETPRLVPTRTGHLWLELGGELGTWRLLTFVAGTTFDKVQSEGQARSAGALVARFHHALDGVDHAFVGMREGVHDTARHLARLREAVTGHPEHRLAAEVRELASSIWARAQDLRPLQALAPRVCHGDLKLNNILFAGSAGAAAERAICLVDLDTVGPLSLAFELGDAWRSWCNPAGEDSTQTAIDLGIFRASFEGYAACVGRTLSGEERTALLLAPEWVSLELAARFAADTLLENYFGWDAQRFSGRGEHNLLRARGQLAVHQAFVAARAERADILGM